MRRGGLLAAIAASLVLAAGPCAAQEPETVLVPAGSSLRSEPRTTARLLTVVDEEVPLVPIESRGDWVLVRWESFKGWVLPIAGVDDTDAEFPIEPDPNLPPEGTHDRKGALERIRVLLGPARTERLFATPPPTFALGDNGRFQLATDVADRKLVRRLERLCDYVTREHTRRFHAPARRRIFVALFARDDGEKALLREEWDLTGIVALSVEGLAPGEIEARFVHRLAHALDRWPWGRVPPWLDEGIAGELSALADVRRPGRYRPAAAEAIARFRRNAAAGRAMPLRVLVEQPQSCVAGEESQLRHPHPALFVDFLTTGPRAVHADRFFGPALAGGRATASELLDVYATDWPTLEREFAAWLRAR